MEKETSIAIVRKQIAEAAPVIDRLGLMVSDIDESSLTFTVGLSSSDDQEYLLHVQFDNYPKWPPLLDFIDKETKEMGVLTAYPASSDSFFNKHNGTTPFICHPCSRKAYKGYTGVHTDWGEYDGWQANAQIGALTNLSGIFEAIYSRLNGPQYNGRME